MEVLSGAEVSGDIIENTAGYETCPPPDRKAMSLKNKGLTEGRDVKTKRPENDGISGDVIEKTYGYDDSKEFLGKRRC